MRTSVIQVEFEVLVLWTLLTLTVIIALSFIYRYVKRSAPKRMDAGAQPAEEDILKKFLFISADGDNARSLLSSALEDVEDGDLKTAVEKASRAIEDVLSQLLRYLSLEGKDKSITDMLGMLHEKGVRLHTHPGGLDRLNVIIKKAREGGELTREETHWMLHVSGFMVEMSKEVRVEE